MTIQMIPLDRIIPNAWQTRQGEPDPAYIKALALDIAANGLLQTPVGRPAGEQIQLAFGHNRLAAYRWLVDVQPHSNIPSVFVEMPVDVRPLTDEQMADYAWSENERRLDLNPLERALAIHKRIEDFGWSHKEVGEHMGLSRPVISNALRLLELPGEMQEKLAGERQLYFNQAYRANSEECVVVEGQADAITLGQWGLSGVALAGTGWRDHEYALKELKKRHPAMYLGMDADEAGDEALVGKGKDWPLAEMLGPMTRIVSWA